MTDIKPVLQTIYIPPTQEVSVRASLSSDWVPLIGVWVDEFTAAAKPAFGQARLSYRAGVGMQLGGPQEINVWSAGDLDQYQVRVLLYDGTDGSLLVEWYGIIIADDREILGSSPDDTGTRRQNLWQTFSALDMGYLLDKVRVNRSIVSGLTEPLGRAIAFNGGRGAARDTNIVATANRSAAIEQNGAHVFVSSLAGASLWTTSDIANYLLKNFQPVVGGVEVPIKFTSDSLIISWDTPLLRAEGRTVKSLLDELFDPRRLVGWAVGWDDASESLLVKVFSYNEDPIDLASGGVVPANNSQVTFDFDSAWDIADAHVRRLSNHRASQVRVRGARRGAVFTVSHADGTLEADWTSSNQTAYNTGASGATGPSYSTLDFSERQKRNRLARGAESLRRVYRYFRIPTTWDFKSNNGENSGSDSPVVPKLDAQGAIGSDSAPLWRPGLSLEEYLPLASGHDYASLPATNNLPDGSIPEPLPVLVFVKTPTTTNDGSNSRWVNGAELVGADVGELAGEAGQRWRISARVQQQNLGLVLDVFGGEQHLIASTEFSAIGDEDTAAALDWQDDLLATVYMESDSHVEVWYPGGAAQAEAGVTILDISGDEYRLDYLAPGTVVGTAVDGALSRNTSGGFLRDDRERMLDHARAAYQWYSRVRSELDVSVRTVLPVAVIGDLVTTIGSGATLETVNTPITRITVSLGHRDSQQPPMTTIGTDFGVTEFGQVTARRGQPTDPQPNRFHQVADQDVWGGWGKPEFIGTDISGRIERGPYMVGDSGGLRAL